MKLKSENVEKNKRITWNTLSFVKHKGDRRSHVPYHSYRKDKRAYLGHRIPRKLPRRLTLEEKVYLYSVRPDLDMIGFMNSTKGNSTHRCSRIPRKKQTNNQSHNRQIKLALHRFLESLALFNSQQTNILKQDVNQQRCRRKMTNCKQDLGTHLV